MSNKIQHIKLLKWHTKKNQFVWPTQKSMCWIYDEQWRRKKTIITTWSVRNHNSLYLCLWEADKKTSTIPNHQLHNCFCLCYMNLIYYMCDYIYMLTIQMQCFPHLYSTYKMIEFIHILILFLFKIVFSFQKKKHPNLEYFFYRKLPSFQWARETVLVQVI